MSKVQKSLSILSLIVMAAFLVVAYQNCGAKQPTIIGSVEPPSVSGTSIYVSHSANGQPLNELNMGQDVYINISNIETAIPSACMSIKDASCNNFRNLEGFVYNSSSKNGYALRPVTSFPNLSNNSFYHLFGVQWDIHLNSMSGSKVSFYVKPPHRSEGSVNEFVIWYSHDQAGLDRIIDFFEIPNLIRLQEGMDFYSNVWNPSNQNLEVCHIVYPSQPSNGLVPPHPPHTDCGTWVDLMPAMENQDSYGRKYNFARSTFGLEAGKSFVTYIRRTSNQQLIDYATTIIEIVN